MALSTKAVICEKLIRCSAFSSSELIDLLASHDTLLKKITCGYLVDKSSLDSNLSLLTANILLRDCSDANPAVRSASLLALSNLSGIEEAAISSISKAFGDSSPQVRRVAPQCCVSIYKHCPETVLRSNLINLLYEGIRDSDPIAVSNCLLALEKILKKEGGLVINKNIANHLLGRLKEFSNSSVVYILTLLKNYIPRNDDETMNILNKLDPCLSSSSPSVLLSAVHLFLNLIKTKQYTHLIADLSYEVKIPLCKILSQVRPELCYSVVSSLLTSLVEIQPSFHDHYKYFLIKTKDPFYLKEKKFQILSSIASEDNLMDIILEVKPYTSDFKNHKNAFECLAILGLNSKGEEEVFNVLSHCIKSTNMKIVEAAFECLLSMFLKKYPVNGELSSTHKVKFPDHIYSSVSLALSKTALLELDPKIIINVLNFVYPSIDNTQDIIEDLWKQFSEWDSSTKCLFITSVCTGFLHCPSVLQHLFSEILSKAVKSEDGEVSSHAMFVYSALEEGPVEAFSLLSFSNFYPLMSVIQ
ncbi:AP-4 complex subunit beta-1 [Armadillidium nasatum]|uniref:AP-4 complex subunit beta-1 n=1 Tax=Armadillidium nasatum TaxID=96803 RepID=A0A5N5SNG9_9CRUS|nr:AP-4 complex subunit beta-1 [Armadillidium nasatum]